MSSYFSNLSPPILGVVTLLLFFSVVSWSIMVWKSFQLGGAVRGNRRFLEVFWAERNLTEAKARCESLSSSPLLPVFLKGYQAGTVSATTGRPSLGTVARLGRALRDAVADERNRFERNLSFLATTASVTPFIGLFGTVWGIMVSFNDIGVAGSTSLDIVAPGISEALVTTAIGLAVAIPASVGFNFLQSRTQAMVETIETFADDVSVLIQAEGAPVARPEEP